MNQESKFSEALVEKAALLWFEECGYFVHTGSDLSPGGEFPLRDTYEEPLLIPRLRSVVQRVNDRLPPEAIDQVIRTVTRPPEPTLAQNNRWFHQLLVNGIEVEYLSADGGIRTDRAWLVDFEKPSRNDFVVASQLIIKHGASTRRLDLVVFLNGLPIAVIELKDPTDEKSNIWSAFSQLNGYINSIPAPFIYNEAMIISDGDVTRVGSLTAGADRYSLWRSLESSQTVGSASLEVLIKGLFNQQNLLDYIRYCVTFEENNRSGQIVKRIATYQQFKTVILSRESVKSALTPAGDGRGGVVWHTQGSGKSLTMLMVAGALIGDAGIGNPTVVVVTDRNDLDDQLFRTFVAGRELLHQPPEQAKSREDLASKLTRASGGVVFTTIQKFEQHLDPISTRSDIVVLADEAHRSQYGFLNGGARWMREAIPNASFIGFTGTPIERDDRNTRAVFGGYVDVYDIRQAIDDGTTVPIYYEMRLVKLLPDDEGISQAQVYLDAIAEADGGGQDVPQSIAVPFTELIGTPSRLKIIAREIVEHFEKRRQVIEGKAMVVCMSREICMDLYDEIVRLRPDWHSADDDRGFVKVVMTGTDAEGERVSFHAKTRARREALAQRFKDPDSDFRLVIVCDMWLTGFDCPPLHTMYLDKPLAGHNLMQAIARVNRVFGEKPGGVVVDFLGIADQLRDAVQTYSQAGGRGSPIHDIQDEAVPVMLRDYESLLGFFYGLDFSGFIGGDPGDQLSAIVAGADFVLRHEDGRRRFMSLVASLSKAFALAVPRPETEMVRDALVYFQSVRAAIDRRLSDSKTLAASDTQAAVRQIISGALVSDGVIDLFEAAGLPASGVGILSDDFLDRLGSLPQENLALEPLRKLLLDQIVSRERINIVQSRDFRDALEAALRRYTNRSISTAQVINELISLARIIRLKVLENGASDLTEQEIAFYDALADNESAMGSNAR